MERLRISEFITFSAFKSSQSINVSHERFPASDFNNIIIYTHLKTLFHIKCCRRRYIVGRIFHFFYHSWFRCFRKMFNLIVAIVIIVGLLNDVWWGRCFWQLDLMISGLFFIWCCGGTFVIMSNNCIVISVQVFVGVRWWYAVSFRKCLRTTCRWIDGEWCSLIMWNSRHSM